MTTGLNLGLWAF